MRFPVKKCISFLLFCAVLLSLALVPGCKDDGKNSGTDTSLTSSLSVVEKETVVWKIYFSDYIEIWQEPLNQLLAEKGAPYTVKIEAYHEAGENPQDAADTLEKMRKNSERADVVAVPDSIYKTMADRELLLPLDDFLQSEQGAKIVNALPARDMARCKYNGVPYGISAHIRTVGGIAYNKQYLEKYEIDASKLSPDIFENGDILQKIKDGEGGGVVPYACNGNLLNELGLWRIDPFECLVYTKNGKAVNIFETTELKEALFKSKDFKDKGFLSFVAESGYETFFATDDFVHRDDRFESEFVYTNKNQQEMSVETVVIPNMKRPQIAPLWGDAQTGVASWSQNRDNALDFLTRLYTDPELANLILYGVEGSEYTLQNGVTTRLPGNLLYVFGENYTNALIAYSQNDTAMDKMAFQTKYYEQCEANIPDGFRFDSAPVAAEADAVSAVYYENFDERKLSSEIYNLLTLKTPDIDAALSGINAKLKAAGIDTIAREFDRQLVEWRTKHEN